MTMVGSPALPFRLQDENGQWISLEDLLVTGPVMLVFYPGDFTMVCTKQLCAYQDSMSQFEKYGIKIVGISRNPPKEHLKFKAKFQFSFSLLSDPNREITKTYGVVSLIMLGGTSRAVFIVSKQGTILYRYIEPTTLTHRKPQELVDALTVLKESNKLA